MLLARYMFSVLVLCFQALVSESCVMKMGKFYLLLKKSSNGDHHKHFARSYIFAILLLEINFIYCTRDPYFPYFEHFSCAKNYV